MCILQFVVIIFIKTLWSLNIKKILEFIIFSMYTSYNEYMIRILSRNTDGKCKCKNIAEWQFLFYKYVSLYF